MSSLYATSLIVSALAPAVAVLIDFQGASLFVSAMTPIMLAVIAFYGQREARRTAAAALSAQAASARAETAAQDARVEAHSVREEAKVEAKEAKEERQEIKKDVNGGMLAQMTVSLTALMAHRQSLLKQRASGDFDEGDATVLMIIERDINSLELQIRARDPKTPTLPAERRADALEP